MDATNRTVHDEGSRDSRVDSCTQSADVNRAHLRRATSGGLIQCPHERRTKRSGWSASSSSVSLVR